MALWRQPPTQPPFQPQPLQRPIPQAGSNAITGTAAVKVATPAIAASGTYTPLAITGTAALTRANPTIAAATKETFTGTAALARSVPNTSASGAQTFTGSVALTRAPPALSASAAEKFSSTAALRVQTPVIASSGTYTPLAITGTAALSVAQPKLAAAGTERFSASAALSVSTPAIAASGTYTADRIGTAALQVPTPSVSAAGSYTPPAITGTAALVVSEPAIASAETETFSASGAVTLTEPRIGAAATLSFSGSAAVTAGTPSVNSSGAQRFSGSATPAVSRPAIAASGGETFTGTAAPAVPRPKLAGSGSETISGSASVAVREPAITAAGTYTPPAITGTATLTVRQPSLAATNITAVTGTAAVRARTPALNASGALAFSGPASLDVPEPGIGATGTATAATTTKPGGKGHRLLTRYRPEQKPRFISGLVSPPGPKVRIQAHATPGPRELTAWLTPTRPTLRLAVHVLNPRRVRAQLLAPPPSLRSCRQLASPGCTTLAVHVARPTLKARLSHTPDEAWLLAVLLSESRDAMRAWDAEATKRLSNLQRESNAQVARTDRQQHRIVQAALPHLRHAFSAQRDAVLVALPHAAKASVDPDYVLNDQGFLNAVALLIQAIEDLQQTGVTLGYTDAADAFNLSSPYVAAAITQLATRVSGITDTTEQAIRDVIAQGLSEGWSVAEMGSAIQDLGAFSESRALTIAATESRVALNTGNAAAWQDMGVDEVLVADGDGDEICAELDGTTVSLDWYMANPIGHPNCRRTATAIPAAVPA